jgi:anthranilate synthase component 1
MSKGFLFGENMKLPKIILSKKPTYLKIAEGLDLFEVFSKIENKSEDCFILESLGEQNSLSRYSIVGFDPKHIISARGNSLFFDDEEFSFDDPTSPGLRGARNPYFALREIVPQDLFSKFYAGGLVGFLSYEAANYFEPSLKLKEHKDFEAFKFGVYLDGLVLDKITGELFYFYYDENRIETVRAIIKAKVEKGNVEVKFLGDTLDGRGHQRNVEYVLDQIKRGNTFQCEVGFKSEFKIEGNSLLIYEDLRKVNPSPFMYYLKFSEQKIVGASPELLFRLKSGDMETFPLAGTIKRGKTEEEDIKLARELLNDPKEIAEHNMLVDLHRNDLGRVAKFGTVKVRSLMDIKKFSHVQHISSEISGVIKEDCDMFCSLSASFPAGTLTGAPKIESMKIINKLENSPRGPYGGAVGHFGFDGNCTFAISIRSLFISGEYGYAQTSGGVVADSEADKEYEEIVRKLAAMKKVLEV